MRRVFILLMDSFGIGALPDAHKFGDTGSNTFKHIALACEQGKADQPGKRQGPLKLPNLSRLGLNALTTDCSGESIRGFSPDIKPEGAHGYAAEISYGKDTPSGHWELMGVPALFEWGLFPKTIPCFPKKLIDDFCKQSKISGILGNKHASGTTILDELGDESVRTGMPIVYTSADSVFQIAAHEEAFGLNRLYEICEIARKLVDQYNIGRIIARPFSGTSGHYTRTANRRDYAVPPPAPTLLDKFVSHQGTVIGIGKIPDIFAHQGISQEIKADGHETLFNKTLEAIKTAPDQTLIFTNFVDFDMKYGHRRDVIGYAGALEAFDARIPELETLLQPGDIVIITADHGCDPTFQGTDHTREYIPLILFGPTIQPVSIGRRDTYADVAQTLAAYFDLPPFEYGKSFLDTILGEIK